LPAFIASKWAVHNSRLLVGASAKGIYERIPEFPLKAVVSNPGGINWVGSSPNKLRLSFTGGRTKAIPGKRRPQFFSTQWGMK
jgi:hypothetical protein